VCGKRLARDRLDSLYFLDLLLVVDRPVEIQCKLPAEPELGLVPNAFAIHTKHTRYWGGARKSSSSADWLIWSSFLRHQTGGRSVGSRRGCSWKNLTISAEASGPLGSV
jgi:hypothetical protein